LLFAVARQADAPLSFAGAGPQAWSRPPGTPPRRDDTGGPGQGGAPSGGLMLP
jgi:hypothetical protein